ncbi:MAG: TIM barrel protein [Planctomycetota bacterium]
MLLTLNASSLRRIIDPAGKKRGSIGLIDLPRHTQEVLGLHGLNLPADLLKGLSRSDLEKVRDAGDKAGCACLALIEDAPQKLASVQSKSSEAAADRISRLIEAARLLGCSAVTVPIEAEDSDAAFERLVEALKRLMPAADRADMNVLLKPMPGLTATPERLTEIIKKVGGFRVGTFPDFVTASGMDDPETYTRRVTPYASVVNASVFDFDIIEPEPSAAPKKPKKTEEAPATPEPVDDGEEAKELSGLERLQADLEALLDEDLEDELEPDYKHKGYDLDPIVAAVTAVGFDGNLGIEYRGEDDVTMGVLNAKAALERAIEESSA